MPMDLLAFNDAAKKWHSLLHAAAQGESVRIDVQGKVVELHLVDPEEASVSEEYDVTEEELNRFEKSVHAEIQKDRESGKLHEYTGDLASLLEGKAD